MIPVLGAAILNRPELIDAMLASIDAPVSKTVIVDNGDAITNAHEYPHRIIQPGHNLGVSAAWNLIMKATPSAPWWLIVNHDIEFGPGDLETVFQAVDPDAEIIYHLLGFAAFVMTAPALERVGYFDENFHPAYDEDLDMSRRCELAGVARTNIDGVNIKHVGSATIYADGYYRMRNGHTHPANDHYYARKWGGHKQGGETFDTPFGRGGHIGDWRLEAERLREQSWER